MFTVLKGATVIDGTGKPPIMDSILIIKDDRVYDIGKIEQVQIPEGAKIIELNGKTIIPGLIDCHIHLEMHGMANTYDENLVEDKLRTLRAAKEMEMTLKRGITTVRNVGSANHIDFAVKQAIKEGWYIGPRIYTSGKVISMTASGNDYFFGVYREADGVDEVRKAAREQLKAGADFLKIMATGAIMNPGGIPGAPQFNIEEIKAVVEEAGKLGLRVASHAHGKEGIINSILAGVKTIEHGTFMDEEVMELLIKNDVYLIPTYVVGHLMLKNGVENGVPSYMIEKSKQVIETKREALRKAINAGVKVAFGTDAGTNFNYHGNNALELVLLVREDFMTPLQAISSATKVASEAVGIENEIGTIEVGKVADLVVVGSSLETSLEPLMDSVEMVFKGGKLVV